MADFELKTRVPDYFQIVSDRWHKKNFVFVKEVDNYTPTWTIWDNNTDEKMFELRYEAINPDGRWQFSPHYNWGLDAIGIVLKIVDELETLAMVSDYLKLKEENNGKA